MRASSFAVALLALVSPLGCGGSGDDLASQSPFDDGGGDAPHADSSHEGAPTRDAGADVTLDVADASLLDVGSEDALDATDGADDSPLDASLDGDGATADVSTDGDAGTTLDASGDAKDAPYDGPPWGSLHQSCGGGASGPCEEVCVTGGAYVMGSVGAWDDNGKMTQADLRPVSVTDFCIDTHEVTIARFRAFFAAGMPSPPEGYPIAPGIAWRPMWHFGIYEPDAERPAISPCIQEGCPVGTNDNCTWALANGQVDGGPSISFENKAVNCVTWYTAAAFCAWDGMRLATEAEWEYVARNRGADESYPWGDAYPTCDQANFSVDGKCTGQPRFYPEDVGSHPAGDTTDPLGVHDMIGGVGEWMMDFYQPYGGSGCWSAGNYGQDPICTGDLFADEWHTRRAGSWQLSALWSEDRARFAAPSAWADMGFRCVRK